MNFNISFDKYMYTLDTVPKVQADYARFKKYDDEKKEILASEKRLLREAQSANAAMRELKKQCDDCYNRIVKLLGAPIRTEGTFATAPITSASELSTALARFNALAEKIVKGGGTEPKPIREFREVYQALSSFFEQCASNSFSLTQLENDIEKGKNQALSSIEDSIRSLHEQLRLLMGLTQEDIRAHQKFASGDGALFKKGFHFPETLSAGIKLGNANISVSEAEAKVIDDVYPELDCKSSHLPVPYIFPINSEKLSRKANIYIEYEDKRGGEAVEQVSIAVHQLILKIISECPLGRLVLHCASPKGDAQGRFVYINARLKGSIKKIKDRDISDLLSDNLCSQESSGSQETAGLIHKEFKNLQTNQFKKIEGETIDHYLYTYFGFSYSVGVEACEQMKRIFELDHGCATFGVHNIIVVAKSDIDQAKRLIDENSVNNREGEAARAWLDTLRVIRDSSDCFTYTDNGYFRLKTDDKSRSITVRLGDKYFPSIEQYDVEESKAIATIEQCNIEAGSPFIDLEGEKAFERTGDFVLAEYNDASGSLKVKGSENIAVIFSDDSFTPDEKSRVMSSVVMGVLTASKPGHARLCLMSNQRGAHIMNVTNGLEGQSDGIRYSLVENDKTQSAQQKIEFWRDSIQATSKLLVEKKRKSGNRDYSIYDLINEDATKYLRVIYDEYTDGTQSFDDIIRNSLIPTVKLSRENRCGMQCVLEINSSKPHEWEKAFADSGVFDHVIVAKNHSFVDVQNRHIKLSVLTDKDDAQTIAHNMLKRYIKAAVTSPTYEEIGFGQTFTALEDIGSTIEIPVGRKDGMPFTMDFDCKGKGLIGYMVQGTTGSGKSSLLFSIIYNGAMKYAPEALQFYLLDFKDGTSFDEFRNSKNPIPHVKQLSVKNDMEDADAIFRNLEDEVVRRSILFKKQGVKDISEYNKAVLKRGNESYMPRLVVVIDECQNAFYSMDSTGMRGLNDLLVNRFESMTRVGRSYGIHFIVATQRMEARLAEKIGAQLSGRCSFKMNSAEDASALLSHSIASQVNNLPRYGSMLFSNDAGASCTQVQVAYDYGEFRKYANEISRYHKSESVTFEIGNETPLRLSPEEMEKGYYLSHNDSSLRVPLAQNCMRDGDVSLTFMQAQNQSLLMVGENAMLASNIVASLLYSTSRLEPVAARTTLYTYTMNTPTANLARSIVGSGLEITNDAGALLEELYFEIEKRDSERKSALEGKCVNFTPWVVVMDNIRKDIFEDPRPTATPLMQTPTANRGLSLNMAAAKPMQTPTAPARKAPERSRIWQTLAEMASEVGIYLCVYLADPRSISLSKDYFKSFKHLITFPCQAIKDCVNLRNGISIPMETTLGNKHVAFTSKLSSNASVCYYVSDSENAETESEELSGGPKVYKIKPYILS